MSGTPETQAVEDIRFRLSTTPDNDRVAILLHLYEGEQLAMTKMIGVARPSMARLMLLGSRLHLLERGLSEHFPTLPRAADLESVRRAA